ncbi:hypothetical protein IQ659_001822, partial [Salmonella enterica]|nr:hypothetical protein [Salmonella enterica]
CEKIFYDKEKVFRKRLLPAHTFDPIEIVIRDFIIPNEAVEREEIIITDKNISIIDDLSLADFDIAFEDVEIPTGDNISDEDMQLAVNSFLSSMKD